jgi:hypothetical protein
MRLLTRIRPSSALAQSRAAILCRSPRPERSGARSGPSCVAVHDTDAKASLPISSRAGRHGSARRRMIRRCGRPAAALGHHGLVRLAAVRILDRRRRNRLQSRITSSSGKFASLGLKRLTSSCLKSCLFQRGHFCSYASHLELRRKHMLKNRQRC